MAITLPSDIVSDVIDAADPAAYRAALDRLARLQSTNQANAADMFAEQAAGVDRARAAKADQAAPGSATPGVVSPRTAASQGGASSVYRKFEGFVLQVMIETMLPNDEGAFGKGTAGVMWRSMLAEQLGTQMAATGGIGIARLLAAAHPAGGAEPQPAPGRYQGQTTEGQQDDTGTAS